MSWASMLAGTACWSSYKKAQKLKISRNTVFELLVLRCGKKINERWVLMVLEGSGATQTSR